ncbi:MAG: tyrosine-type recombinase/integrase [Thermoleophilaceae bacterium]
MRVELRRLAAQAGVRRRFAPHQLRHAHALELAREGVPLNIIQRPTRARQSRHHIHLPARHLPRGDHRQRPRQTCPDDVRHSRTATLTNTRERERHTGAPGVPPATPRSLLATERHPIG